MALAVHSAEAGRQNRLLLFLLLTMFIGAIFIAIKFTEYYLPYQDHKAPGFWFE
jgi:heme/copper-type cytochrome/quinol oxidase subunit 3